jgi:hypothetical protein
LSSSLRARFKQIPFRRRLRIIVLLAIGLGLLLWTLWGQWQRRLTIENRSGQVIEELRVTYAGETRTIRNVPPAGKVTVPAGDENGDHYTVEIKLGDARIRSSGVATGQRELVVLPNRTVVPGPVGKEGH